MHDPLRVAILLVFLTLRMRNMRRLVQRVPTYPKEESQHLPLATASKLCQSHGKNRS